MIWTLKVNKEFEYLFFPGTRHTSGGVYGERKRRDFYVQYLIGVDPSDWNMMEK